MDRNDRIRLPLSKGMRLIEIGASYNPIVPKRDGWQTTVVDHASRTELAEKYRDLPMVDAIEEVDIVWRDGALADAFPTSDHGTYDGLIASHVLEHVPDMVAFLRAADALLKRSATVFLALPDKRLCFDFFQPLSTIGNVLDGMGRSRHSRGTMFDHATYFARRNDLDTWLAGDRGGTFTLAHPLEATRHLLNYQETGDYVDCHTWRFTPASFQLLILEMNALGLIPWRVARIEPQSAVEFFAWLERGESAQITVDQQRIHLLRDMIMETKEQVQQMEPAPAQPQQPTISAIIPLFNGRRFIAQSLKSIIAQTLPPQEIIVVDDGSSDEGGEIVKQFIQERQSGPPIILLRKENGGQSSARNFGVRHSTGDLIALLDQDDSWYPDHLAELIKPFLRPQAGKELGWVYSDLDEYDGQDGVVHHCYLDAQNLGTQHPKTHLFAALQGNMFILPSASLISRKAFEAIGGFDERLSGYEDDDLFLRMFRAGYANVFLKTALSKWRIYQESSSYTYRMRRSRAIYLRKLLDTYPDDPRVSRFLTRDLILPRFYNEALADFVKALRSNDHALIEETRAELLFVLKRMPGRRKKLLRQVVSRIRTPRAIQIINAIRAYVRPITRRVV